MITPDSGNEGGDFVKEPTDSDVLCGRGGSINSHPGNERFRTLVEKRKRIYLTARFKREKRLIASSIVSEIRALNPSGRFLSRDAKTGKWKDIGDEKARDKTSQALRENAPSIRAEIETEINEQRAEMMMREEEARVATQSHHHPHAPPPPAHHHHHPGATGSASYYGSQGWGYHSYYGYTHPSMPPPPPPPHAHGYPPPPPPPPSSHGYAPHWGAAPPPPHAHAQHYTQAQQPSPPPPPPSSPPKSVLEATAESIRSWIPKATLSFGGGISTQHSNDDNRSRSTAGSNKPIVYVHHDAESKKRRMVKFRDDAKHSRRHTSTSSRRSVSSLGTNSLVDGMLEPLDHREHDLDDDDDAMEPHAHSHETDEDDEHTMSLMTQISNHILTSIGSWDASAIVCGHDSTHGAAEDRLNFFRGSSSGHTDAAQDALGDYADDDMAVEWEGQEVQLVDPTEESTAGQSSPARMPPPTERRPENTTSSIGLSSLGSCHSGWLLADQLGSAASLFSRNDNHQNTSAANHYSTNGSHHSMTMDYHSAGGGSLGGNSLTRVFENETLDEPFFASGSSPHMSHRALNQMPSWERSVRSRSPLSVGSAGGGGGGPDDVSLISKTSSKLSESGLSVTGGVGGLGSPLNGDGSMVWETRE